MANCAQCGRKLPPFSLRKICEWCVRHEAAQRGEESEDTIQPVMPTPWEGTGSSSMMVTQALVALNVLVFVIMAAQGIALNPSGQALIDRGANYAPLTLGGQPWRLITALFLHGGFMHILFNMWCLWDLGGLCESLYGHVTFALVYLISGIGSSLASAWWHPAILSVGASGAVFGIVGALIASYYLGELTMPSFAIRGHLRSLIAFVVFNTILGQVLGGVDHAAHFGGLATGLLFGALIARVAPASGGLRRAAAILFVTLVVAGCGAWLYQSRSYLAHVSRAEDFLYEHQTDQGIAELQEVIRQRPNYLPAHAELAHQYLNRKKYDLAEAELQLILKAQPQSEEARYELGIVYLNTQRFGAAKDLFTQMVKADNQDGYAHFGLARALAAEQNYADAVEEYKQAAQLEPDLETVNYRLGLAQIQLKNYDEAIAAFGQQQKIRGDNADSETALAEAYRAKGMQAEADAALKRAEQLKAKY